MVTHDLENLSVVRGDRWRLSWGMPAGDEGGVFQFSVVAEEGEAPVIQVSTDDDDSELTIDGLTVEFARPSADTLDTAAGLYYYSVRRVDDDIDETRKRGRLRVLERIGTDEDEPDPEPEPGAGGGAFGLLLAITQ